MSDILFTFAFSMFWWRQNTTAVSFQPNGGEIWKCWGRHLRLYFTLLLQHLIGYGNCRIINIIPKHIICIRHNCIGYFHALLILLSPARRGFSKKREVPNPNREGIGQWAMGKSKQKEQKLPLKRRYQEINGKLEESTLLSFLQPKDLMEAGSESMGAAGWDALSSSDVVINNNQRNKRVKYFPMNLAT